MRCLFPIAIVAALLLMAGCQKPAEEETSEESEVELTSPHSATLADAMAEAPQKEEVLDDKGGEFDAVAIKLTAPAGWGRKRASSGFLMAEYVLPRAQQDDADGRLTISSAGGSIEANIDRWRAQFGGKPAKESQENIQVEGLDVTMVDFSGDFHDQHGMTGTSVMRKNCRMIAAIIPAGEQSIFIKAYGPQATMELHAAKFQEFVKSARKKP